jgi:hypothetical protein
MARQLLPDPDGVDIVFFDTFGVNPEAEPLSCSGEWQIFSTTC